jgi:hypothetical protein
MIHRVDGSAVQPEAYVTTVFDRSSLVISNVEAEAVSVIRG